MAHRHEYVLIASHIEADGSTGAPLEGQEALDLFQALELDGVHQHPHGTLVVTNGEEGPAREGDYVPMAAWVVTVEVE